MKEELFFNTPVQLLHGFLQDSSLVLNNVFDYCVFTNSLKYDYSEGIDAFKASSKYFGVRSGDIEKSFINGRELYDSIDENSPKVGISITKYFEYYNDPKTEFDKVCFLGFLGLKSIIGRKSCCKVTNRYWWARMDGKTHTCELDDLSSEIQKYANEYQLKKIKNELILNWYLIHYSRYNRGFYVSFKMDLESLILYAEKRRQTRRLKDKKREENEAYERAMKKLNDGKK